jgi:hypothetical protein
MRSLVFILSAGAALIVTAFAATPKSVITKEMVLEAITTFRTDPLSPNAQASARLVKNFAESSPDVMVTVTKKAVPLISHHEIPISESGPLTAAFVVGNVRSQFWETRRQTIVTPADFRSLKPIGNCREEIPNFESMRLRNSLSWKTRKIKGLSVFAVGATLLGAHI